MVKTASPAFVRDSLPLRISPALANEYLSRDVHHHAEMKLFPDCSGTWNARAETARAMLADAEHQADAKAMDNDFGTRRIYAAIRDQIRAALAQAEGRSE
jgi:hypothetical protein